MSSLSKASTSLEEQRETTQLEEGNKNEAKILTALLCEDKDTMTGVGGGSKLWGAGLLPKTGYIISSSLHHMLPVNREPMTQLADTSYNSTPFAGVILLCIVLFCG